MQPFMGHPSKLEPTPQELGIPCHCAIEDGTLVEVDLSLLLIDAYKRIQALQQELETVRGLLQKVEGA